MPLTKDLYRRMSGEDWSEWRWAISLWRWKLVIVTDSVLQIARGQWGTR